MTSSALQKWIGLSVTFTNTEMEPILDNGIMTELGIGLGNLPSDQFETMFTQNIVSQQLQHKKEWYR